MKGYFLITPVRNEKNYIGGTIESVIRQTVLPIKWVIVSDGSTDGTNEIIAVYAKRHEWILPLYLERSGQRNFAGKVWAFRAGYDLVAHLPHRYVANLDADVSIEPDYFEYLISRLESDPALGLVGTPYRENSTQYDYRFSRREHVSGACQVFRKECYESIGGYRALEAGGVDVVAAVMARMNGWKTWTFTEKCCLHHKPMGSGSGGIVRRYFRSGFFDYPLGVNPMWQLLRCTYQMTRRPWMIGGIMLFAGYLWAAASGAKSPVSREFIKFRRDEQMKWMREQMKAWLRRKK